MTESRSKVLDALEHIPASSLDYDEWLRVGMALHTEGFTWQDWDSWSREDSRYHGGECERKWETFDSLCSNPVRAGSIYKLASDRGWRYTGTYTPTSSFSTGAEQLRSYLEVLFNPDETVSYVSTDVWQDEDGKWMPKKGVYSRTAGELIQSLEKHPEDIAYTIGDTKDKAGAWIRFNPVDGKGVRNDNITALRFALVESDDMPLAEQERILRESNLPIAALVYSGGKSLHAIVHIDAPNLHEYNSRVKFLYSYLEKRGMSIDRQNKNPSRLSRMPGVMRNGKLQSLIGTKLGAADWVEWYASAEEETSCADGDEVRLSDIFDNPPDLPEELISGVLRSGHKMLLSGSSKAGKSFLLMELAVAFAEGTDWLGFHCRKSRVLYINLEIDPASCPNRFVEIYKAAGIKPENIGNITIVNLRGKAKPLDELADDVIRRAKRLKADVIIIDPIYKIITGDENNASEMGYFCNQFDKICMETGAACIYCHHHSKGAQGAKKAMDRASGSGVFARDPDAALDMIQLELSDDIKYNIRDGNATAWRLEGSLREFESFQPVNFWFKYPIHIVDNCNLSTSAAEGSFEAMRAKNRKNLSKEERAASVSSAYNACMFSPPVTVKAMAEYAGCSERAMRDRIKERSDFSIQTGIVSKLPVQSH